MAGGELIAAIFHVVLLLVPYTFHDSTTVLLSGRLCPNWRDARADPRDGLHRNQANISTEDKTAQLVHAYKWYL